VGILYQSGKKYPLCGLMENDDRSNLMHSKKVRNPLKRHSGEGRNPVVSVNSGCRIKSGMTNLDFLRDHQFYVPEILQIMSEANQASIWHQICYFKPYD